MTSGRFEGVRRSQEKESDDEQLSDRGTGNPRCFRRGLPRSPPGFKLTDELLVQTPPGLKREELMLLRSKITVP